MNESRETHMSEKQKLNAVNPAADQRQCAHPRAMQRAQRTRKISDEKKIVTSFYTMLLFETFQILLPFRQILLRLGHFLRLVI
jgi:hypothetical protein